mgnify:CR=1 FL=1
MPRRCGYSGEGRRREREAKALRILRWAGIFVGLLIVGYGAYLTTLGPGGAVWGGTVIGVGLINVYLAHRVFRPSRGE